MTRSSAGATTPPTTTAGRLPVPVAAAFLALAAIAPPAEASCTTTYCQYFLALHERNREAELVSQLGGEGAGEPAAGVGMSLEDALLRLDDLLQRKLRREREIHRYLSLRTWSRTEPADLEARVQAENLHWRSALRRAAERSPRVACSEARRQSDPKERLEALRQALARAKPTPVSDGKEETRSSADADFRPPRAMVTMCLARELVEQGQIAEAEALVEGLLREMPDWEASRFLRARLPDRPGAQRAFHLEMARRWPRDRGIQLDLLVHLLEEPRSGADLAAARQQLHDLLGRPLSIDDHLRLCHAVDEVPDLHLECWQAARTRPFPEEEPVLREAMREEAARGLYQAHWRLGEADAAEGWIDALPAESRLNAWQWLLHESKGGVCSRFLAAFDREDLEGDPFASTFQASTAAAGARQQEMALLGLVSALETCGAAERLRDLRISHGLGDPVNDAPTLLHLLSRHGGYGGYGGEGLPMRSTLLALAETAADSEDPLSSAEAWVAAEPESVPAWLYRSAVHRALARRAPTPELRRRHEDQALASLDAAIAAHPDDLDLASLAGVAALQLSRPDRVREAAQRLRSRHATPRHRAEADYLLGRLARREGRWEEASDRLAAYFLERVRYDGRSPEPPFPSWERPFFLHLVEAGHRERLARYLEAREVAHAEFLAHLPPRPEWLQRRGDPLRRPLAGPDPALLALGCVSPRRAALEERGRVPPGGDRPIEGAHREPPPPRPLCSSTELPDPDPLFLDDDLLAYGWDLRGVG